MKEGQEKPQWYSPTECLEIDYPNKIITASKPEEQCCTEELFYCPNIQDAPAECGEEGDFTIEVNTTTTPAPTTTTTTTTPAPTTTTTTTTTSPPIIF